MEEEIKPIEEIVIESTVQSGCSGASGYSGECKCEDKMSELLNKILRALKAANIKIED